MKMFRVGDTANGVRNSEKIISAANYEDALEQVVGDANLYCEEANSEDTFLWGVEKMLEHILQNYKKAFNLGDTVLNTAEVAELIKLLHSKLNEMEGNC